MSKKFSGENEYKDIFEIQKILFEKNVQKIFVDMGGAEFIISKRDCMIHLILNKDENKKYYNFKTNDCKKISYSSKNFKCLINLSGNKKYFYFQDNELEIKIETFFITLNKKIYFLYQGLINFLEYFHGKNITIKKYEDNGMTTVFKNFHLFPQEWLKNLEQVKLIFYKNQVSTFKKFRVYSGPSFEHILMYEKNNKIIFKKIILLWLTDEAIIYKRKNKLKSILLGYGDIEKEYFHSFENFYNQDDKIMVQFKDRKVGINAGILKYFESTFINTQLENFDQDIYLTEFNSFEIFSPSEKFLDFLNVSEEIKLNFKFWSL